MDNTTLNDSLKKDWIYEADKMLVSDIPTIIKTSSTFKMAVPSNNNKPGTKLFLLILVTNFWRGECCP